MEFGNKHPNDIILHLQQSLRNSTKNLRLQISCCCLCGSACQQHPLLCQYCQADLPYFNHQLVPHDLLTWPAIAELIQSPYFDHLVAVAPYAWPFDMWISQLKYQLKTELAELLSYLLIKHWRQYLAIEPCDITPDNTWVLAVPLHLRKWQERGFNQAHLIAQKFVKSFAYHYPMNVVVREKFTENQVGKSGIERRKNLKNAFRVNFSEKIALPEHIILIDDVVTTGTTANEICRLLKKRGVQKITLLNICIALPSS